MFGAYRPVTSFLRCQKFKEDNFYFSAVLTFSLSLSLRLQKWNSRQQNGPQPPSRKGLVPNIACYIHFLLLSCSDQRISTDLWREEVWKQKRARPGIKARTCFLGRSLYSSSNSATSWAPWGSSLFTQQTVEEVSQHSLIGSPRCNTDRPLLSPL